MEVSKERMIELVKNAPEGATHYKSNVSTYLAVRGNVSAFIHGQWVVLSTPFDSTMEFASSIKLDYSVSEDKPVYTKEMQEAGDLPPVGCKCEVFTYDDPVEVSGMSWHRTTILSIGHLGFGAENIVTYACNWSPNFYVDAHPAERLKFRPVDNRTDQEKLIDEMVMAMHDLNTKDWHSYVNKEFNITRKGESND